MSPEQLPHNLLIRMAGQHFYFTCPSTSRTYARGSRIGRSAGPRGAGPQAEADSPRAARTEHARQKKKRVCAPTLPCPAQLHCPAATPAAPETIRQAQECTLAGTHAGASALHPSTDSAARPPPEHVYFRVSRSAAACRPPLHGRLCGSGSVAVGCGCFAQWLSPALLCGPVCGRPGHAPTRLEARTAALGTRPYPLHRRPRSAQQHTAFPRPPWKIFSCRWQIFHQWAFVLRPGPGGTRKWVGAAVCSSQNALRAWNNALTPTIHTPTLSQAIRSHATSLSPRCLVFWRCG